MDASSTPGWLTIHMIILFDIFSSSPIIVGLQLYENREREREIVLTEIVVTGELRNTNLCNILKFLV